jgi:hypothetical protein
MTAIRSLTGKDAPSKTAVRQARKLSGCTMSECAASVYVPTVTWHSWELGKARMHPAIAELFAIKMLKDKV